MRKLYISATSLRDFNVCPKMYYYRTNFRDGSVINDDVRLGSIIHEAIEKYPTYESALAYAQKAWEEVCSYSHRKPPKSIPALLDGYYSSIKPDLDIEKGVVPLVEHFFRFNYRNDIILLGKMDLVVNDCIFDWKTSRLKPSAYELHSPQFAIYHIAYTEIFKKPPEKIWYGHLLSGKLFEVPIDKAILRNTEMLIDRMEATVRAGLIQERVLGYSCGSCFFRGICYEELKNESTSQ